MYAVPSDKVSYITPLPADLAWEVVVPPPPKGQPLDDVVVTVKLQKIDTVDVNDVDAESTTSFLPSLPLSDSINSLNVPVNSPSSTARSYTFLYELSFIKLKSHSSRVPVYPSSTACS